MCLADRARLAAALLVTATATAAWPAVGDAPRTEAPARLTLAVIPTLPPVRLHKAWTPVVEHLGRELGVKIELALFEELQSFLDAAMSGTPDLVFLPPNMFVPAHRAQGYVPLVRGARFVTGVVVVRKDSPYRTIADLRGKTIAFVGNRSLCAVITRHAIETSGEDIDYNATFAGSTVNVAKMVVLGKVDAGAALDLAFDRDAPETAGLLRTILETPPVAPHPLAAHPRVPPAVQARIAAAVLALGAAPEGEALLAGVRLGKPVPADYDRDYRVFEAIPFEHPVTRAR